MITDSECELGTWYCSLLLGVLNAVHTIFVLVLGIEFRVSHMLGKLNSLQPQIFSDKVKSVVRFCIYL
jgi:hypothetical protein